MLLNARSCVGLKGENKMRIGRGGRSETSLSSYRKYKGEMFISKGIQPPSTTKMDYLWVSLQTISSQPVFHKQRSPSSSYWHYWYSYYTLKIRSAPLITTGYPTPKNPYTFAPIYTSCLHTSLMILIITSTSEGALHRKTTNTNDQRAFRASAYSLLGWVAENRCLDRSWLINPCKTGHDMMSFAVLPEEDHCFMN